MPAFSTPEPISAAIEMAVGDIRITATEREDTVVEIRPSDGAHEPDVRVAEQTRVEYTAAGLLIKGPKQRSLGLRKIGSIDVTIELPAGSSLRAEAAIAALHCVGRMGECRVKAATGDIELERTGPVDLTTSAGTIAVDSVAGHAEVSTGTGRVRMREIDGSAVVKNSNGDTWVGEISGDLRVNAANGTITVDRAGAGVNATTANGDVRIGDVSRGSVALKTGFGELEIGIHAGTAAKVDAYTNFGTVHNAMDAAASPESADEIVEVRARTSFGDIVIRRS